jgi:F0F1-type ATP synthase assembly protein I
VTQPPDYPGRRRVKRAAASAAGDAYQGAFEAVMAVLVGAGFGYWVDRRWETTPYGVIVGVVIGFAAMVLRLLRMRDELPPPPAGAGSGVGASPGSESDRGPAEMPGVDDLWDEEGREGRRDAGRDERD